MANKLIGECIDELGLKERTIVVMPVGCSTMGLRFWDMDMVSCAHGRAPAVATGIKRTQPGAFVFAYQGDGDLASASSPSPTLFVPAVSTPWRTSSSANA